MRGDAELKKSTWAALSRYVRARDGKCVTCPGPAQEAGHYRHNSERAKTFGGNALWYDLRNINAQCTRCNKWLSSNPTQYALYLEATYGAGILQELNGLYSTPKKWKREEIEAKRAEFERAFNALAFTSPYREGIEKVAVIT